MASNHSQGGKGGTGNGAVQRRAPEWADGMKPLYDSVVEEDLHDSLKDMLDRLDGGTARRGPGVELVLDSVAARTGVLRGAPLTRVSRNPGAGRRRHPAAHPTRQPACGVL